MVDERTGGGNGGNGGRGGIGLSAPAGGTIENTGNIAGGQGGTRGLAGIQYSPPQPADGAVGPGGVGIEAHSTTITNSGIISGGVSGDGVSRASAVRFTGGSNTLNLQSGSTIIGAVELANASTTAIIQARSEGRTLASPLILGGAATVNTAGHGMRMSGPISGTGSFTKTGSGELTLTGVNTHLGGTIIGEGTLRAGAPNTFSSASAHTVAPGALLDLAGHSQTVAVLSNGGNVSLLGSAPGTTLTVTGPYVGDNGTLRLGTALGGSSSASDRLVLSGAGVEASGRTTVQVINLGGLGASTSGNGIELVSAINGATTTAQTTKDAFALAGGHVDAGAFEYRLHAADAAGAGENWYLRSTTTLVAPPAASPAPVQPDVPADPTVPVAPLVPVVPVAPLVVEVPTFRAEVPLFAALPEQLRQGNMAMLGNLHQRTGDDQGGERRAWGRVVSTGADIRQRGTVDPRSDGRWSGFQAGTDLLAHTNGRAGLYVGQLDSDMRVSGFAGGSYDKPVGSNELRSRFLGGYATWRGQGGFYADAVLQAGQHRYAVRPFGRISTRGKGSSTLASLEVGQSIALAEGWQIEPQLQLAHQRVELDDASIVGAHVQQESDKGWLLRAGVRAKGEIATGVGKLQPYGRFNVYRASSGSDVARFAAPVATTDIASSTGGTAAELAGGFTLALGENTSLYGEVGKLWASGGETRVKSSVRASAGLRIRW
jgi:outer membrane autotransporter protein